MADNKNEIHTYTGSKPFAFISYSHDDLDIISEYLGAIDENYRFWYDEGIKSGAEWVEEIGNKIFDCDIFIVFLSKSALQSHYIIPMLPICIRRLFDSGVGILVRHSANHFPPFHSN